METLGGILETDVVALATVVLRTVTVYLALLLGLRLVGKRELGQWTSLDLVLILIISNAVQNAMVGPDTSLTGGLVAAASLLGLNWALHQIGLKWLWLEHRVVGSPTLLVNDGRFVEANMRREGVDRDDVMMALREHGIGDVNEVAMAVLELDGTVSVVPRAGDGARRGRHRLRGRKPLV